MVNAPLFVFGCHDVEFALPVLAFQHHSLRRCRERCREVSGEVSGGVERCREVSGEVSGGVGR